MATWFASLILLALILLRFAESNLTSKVTVQCQQWQIHHQMNLTPWTEVNVHSSLTMKWAVPLWVVLLLILPMIHQWLMRHFCQQSHFPFIFSWLSTSRYMPLRKGFCHHTSVNTTLKATLQLNYFLVTKSYHSLESNPSQDNKYPQRVFLVALANLKALLRASNAVFILIIAEIPSRKVLCSATDHQIFPTTIDYFPSSQLSTVVSLLAWRTHWPMKSFWASKNSHSVVSRSLRCM